LRSADAEVRRLKFSILSTLALAPLLTTGAAAQPAAEASFPVEVRVDAARPQGELKPIWRFFGADEPNYATMKDGRKLIAELGELRPGEVYFRTHNLMNTGDGTPSFKWGSTNLYTEDKAGRPVYDFTGVDRIIDTYLARGVRPYLQFGFMPEALADAPAGERYQHIWRPGFDTPELDGAWNRPPKDYAKWAEVVYQWTRHNVERYGRAEVERWYFEVWNEPNLSMYWKGSREDFFKLHDYAVAAIRRALPTARVGGGEVAGPDVDWMKAFLGHLVDGRNAATGGTGTPTDFVSFHAKGQPRLVDGHVEMGIATQLQNVDKGLSLVAATPALAAKPVVIGENDPEGCAACPGPANGYRNGTMYSSYTAAVYARIWELAAERNVNLEGALSWAFTFEDQPYFAGYRQIATNGIDLPVLNVFRLFSRLGPERIAASSDHEVPLRAIEAQGVRGAPDVGVLASRGPGGRIAVLVWHYHDDDVAGPDAQVHVRLAGLGPAPLTLTRWQVDRRHADAFTAWKAMGAPISPSHDQYLALQAAAKLTMAEPQRPVRVSGGSAEADFILPRQGVALLMLEPGASR
jgi:xylan 1,4-beta-xylosidase